MHVCFFKSILFLTFIVMQTLEINPSFNLASRFINETQESIFVTGNAGTGKTSFLQYIRQHSPKNMIVAAPTGVAAINAAGVTLHSLFQLPFGPFIPTPSMVAEIQGSIRQNKQKLDLLRAMDVLVIDEISMVRSDVLDAIDAVLRQVRRQKDKAFGGTQLLLIGDLHQLPPVTRVDDWEILSPYYASPYFFDSKAIVEVAPLLIEFSKVYRQQDTTFIDLLNNIRNFKLESDDLEKLNTRYNPAFEPPSDEKYIILTSHNNQADRFNRDKLEGLGQRESRIYKAEINNDFPESMYPNDPTLELKIGAQVMFNKNDNAKRLYYNGKIGVIHALDVDEIIVDCNGELIPVGRETWENIKYSTTKKKAILEQKIIGTYTHFPLRLAWAITIHKSQGLTFDKVMIDAANSFSSGQVYVALSRCRSLEGIVLLSKIQPGAIHYDGRITQGLSRMTSDANLEEMFIASRNKYCIKVIHDIFDFNEIVMNTNFLAAQLRKESDHFGKEALRWSEAYKDGWKQLVEVSANFARQIDSMTYHLADVGNDDAIKNRMFDAGRYFSPRIEELATTLQAHPLRCDTKESSEKVTAILNDLNQGVFRITHFLKNVAPDFSLLSFLDAKLSLTMPDKKLSAYAGTTDVAIATGGIHDILYNRLVKWRNYICRQQDKPVYLVANSASLQQISIGLPRTLDHLMAVHGFGPAKARQYGEEILDMVSAYCEEFDIRTEFNEDDFISDIKPRSKAKEKVISQAKKPKEDTRLVTLQLFKEGKSIQEIAELRALKPGTIENHIGQLIIKGELPVSTLVDAQSLKEIQDTLFRLPGDTSLSALKQLLPDRISFRQIEVVRDLMRKKEG